MPSDKSIRLFSYKQTDDTGFAPNPFHGVCTLATCKADYYRDSAYAAKIPPRGIRSGIDAVGDNIYYLVDGRPEQVRNVGHPRSLMTADVAGEFVLIGRRFYYFGSAPLVVPAAIRPTVPTSQAGAGWRTHDLERAKAFIDWVDSKGQGRHAMPHGIPMPGGGHSG